MNMRKVNEIMQIDLDGFQVVKGDLFITSSPKGTVPLMTVRNGKISFSKKAVTEMNSCERIRIEVNPVKRNILILPVTSSDKDAVRWTKNIKDPLPRTLTCKDFTEQLYEMWGWDNGFDYKALGKVAAADKNVGMVFDFNDPEKIKRKERKEK